MPKLNGLNFDESLNQSNNGTGNLQIFEICTCSSGVLFTASIESGCVDASRTSGICVKKS